MIEIDEWVEWMIRNPELADENYPELMQGFKNKIKEIEPYRTALIIQKLPEHFPKWKKEAKKHFGIRRDKIIQGYIDVISAVLFEYEYPSELENKAIESIKDELYEQLEYWNEKMRKNEKTNNLSEAVALMSLGKEKFIVPKNSKQTEIKLQFKNHEKLFEAVIFSANEVQDKPIEGAFELLKEVWFFLNSDNATFNGKDIEKNKRPLLVNPNFLDKPDFDNFFEAEITYCSMQNKIGLNEQDFIVDISHWIEKKSKDESFSIPQKRKFKEFLEFINSKELPPQPIVKQKPELKLKDFFIKDFSSDIIIEIQAEFKELEGKDLAILIYLLHREHKIIEILTNSNTKGRKGFVKCLKETDNPTMQKVNKCFVSNTDDLIYSKDDLVFQSLYKRLTKTIEK